MIKTITPGPFGGGSLFTFFEVQMESQQDSFSTDGELRAKQNRVIQIIVNAGGDPERFATNLGFDLAEFRAIANQPVVVRVIEAIRRIDQQATATQIAMLSNHAISVLRSALRSVPRADAPAISLVQVEAATGLLSAYVAMQGAGGAR